MNARAMIAGVATPGPSRGRDHPNGGGVTARAPPRDQRRLGVVTGAAKKDEGKKGIFSFVTDNESSRNAIYVDEEKAYVGEMTQKLKGKGEEGGRYVEAAATTGSAVLTWCAFQFVISIDWVGLYSALYAYV